MIRIDVEIVVMNHEQYVDADARFTRKMTIEIPVVYGNELAWSITESLIARAQQMKEEILSEGFGIVK